VSVTLPSTLKWIGIDAFGGCPALATSVVPNGCRVHPDAFRGSMTRVTAL
jgi:hypothetical protein